jgi:hypothetical protein
VASSREQGPSGSNREADEDGGSGTLALPLRCALVDGLEFFFDGFSLFQGGRSRREKPSNTTEGARKGIG